MQCTFARCFCVCFTVAVVGALVTTLVAAEPAHGRRSTPGRRPAVTTTPRPANTEELGARIDAVVDHYRGRPVNTHSHSPWEVMHWIVAYGVDAQILQQQQRREEITAIGWLCFNRSARGQQMFYLSGGQLRAMQGPGVQGHAGQFLAILAQSKVMIDYPLRVRGKDFTVADLVEAEKLTCASGSELTFKLIALNHYLEPDAVWENEAGQRWDIERLVREELAQPVRGAACGGTHRLAGLSLAVRKRLDQGLPLEGNFARADQYIRQYQRYALKLQNSDGSFSTQWLRGRGANRDPDRRLKTSGHIFEWLTLSLPEEDLSSPQMQRAADYLTSLLWQGRDRQWEIGPLGHGIHGLAVYRERALPSGQRPATLSQQAISSAIPLIEFR